MMMLVKLIGASTLFFIAQAHAGNANASVTLLQFTPLILLALAVYLIRIAVRRYSAKANVGNIHLPMQPDATKRWSWSAFLLSPIWAIRNRVWVGLLPSIFIVLMVFTDNANGNGLSAAGNVLAGLSFIFQCWLGIKGRELSWKTGIWKNADEYIKSQTKWDKFSIYASLAFFAFCIIVVVAVSLLMR